MAQHQLDDTRRGQQKPAVPDGQEQEVASDHRITGLQLKLSMLAPAKHLLHSIRELSTALLDGQIVPSPRPCSVGRAREPWKKAGPQAFTDSMGNSNGYCSATSYCVGRGAGPADACELERAALLIFPFPYPSQFHTALLRVWILLVRFVDPQPLC